MRYLLFFLLLSQVCQAQDSTLNEISKKSPYWTARKAILAPFRKTRDSIRRAEPKWQDSIMKYAPLYKTDSVKYAAQWGRANAQLKYQQERLRALFCPYAQKINALDHSFFRGTTIVGDPLSHCLYWQDPN